MTDTVLEIRLLAGRNLRHIPRIPGIFVPVAGLPSPLREFAEYNPLTALATAIRQLFHAPTGPLPDVWTLQHPVLASVAWAFGLMAVFGPLAVRRYQRLGR